MSAHKNIFLVYMPLNNLEAMAHYRDTIQNRVGLDRIVRYLSRDQVSRVRQIFGNRPIAVWGSRDGSQNRAKFEKMSEGDHLLIVEGSRIKAMGKIAIKLVNKDLSRELWHNINDPAESSGWDLIYFIANPVEVDTPFRSFCKLFGYKENLQLRGLTTVSAERLEAFYAQYDDLYSILIRIHEGQPVAKKESPPDREAPIERVANPEADQPDMTPPDQLVSDHVRMQWKLANLGRKAGEKVWVPSSDQRRLRDTYDFTEFEAEFAAGIDLPKNYFENIDVVWKEEFRINAAFEVENSTAIYSGLLRFADLNVVAPNTTYPMFIVAPSERRNRVREQLLRPAFQRLDLRGKVLFLPYETVDAIDQFFERTDSGMSVALIQGRAESLA